MSVPLNSKVLSPLTGQSAQGCWLGHGNVLFLEFGKPQPLSARENHPKGEWGLWSDHIEWRLERRGRIVAGSEDDRATMEAGIDEINGTHLLSGVIYPTGDSTLSFSNDLVLRTFVITTEEDAQWNFRDPPGYYSRLVPDRIAFSPEPQEGDTSSDNPNGPQQFSKFLAASQVWRVAVDVQYRFEDGYEPSDADSIQLEFRNNMLNSVGAAKHNPIGSLRIDTNTCGVRLEQSGEIIAACGDSSEKLLTQFKRLVGKKLVYVKVIPPAGDTSLVLEDGWALRCFPATSSRGDIWCICSADGHELVLGPGGQWSYSGSLD